MVRPSRFASETIGIALFVGWDYRGNGLESRRRVVAISNGGMRAIELSRSSLPCLDSLSRARVVSLGRPMPLLDER